MSRNFFGLVVLFAFTTVITSAGGLYPAPTPSLFAPLAKPALNGFVDMHTHPMSHLAFGGKVIHGAPDVGVLMPAIPSGNGCRHYDRPTSIDEALSSDRATFGGWGLFDNTCGDDIRKAVVRNLESKQKPPANTGHHEEGSRGYPDFYLWPDHNDITHQSMWIDWIRRAHDGGLNVMVALSVNNSTIAAAANGTGDINADDVSSSDVQIAEMKSMIARHSDFMRVVTSPSQLRSVVSSGKLAVILGAEIDNIGNFHKNNSLNPDQITEISSRIVDAELTRLYNQGISYIFPIHVVNNKFGGTAIYIDTFNISNYHQTGSFWDIQCADASSGITHKFEVEGWDAPFAAVKAKIGIDAFRNPPTPPDCDGHVNRLGLTNLGRYAIKKMMKMGFIIDVDHMSQKAVNETLSLAENFRYPVTSGHDGPRGINGNENGRTDLQYRRISDLNGMIGLGASGNGYDFVQTLRTARGLVKNNRIAIGTDANGLVALPGPDPDATVTYDASFPRLTTGNKTWDINRDGVANYGLLGDYVRSWSAPGVGLTADEKAAFFNTAEGFAQMWERIQIASSYGKRLFTSKNDFDGDGRADLAIWRPSEGNWWIAKSTGGTTTRQWGVNGDVPVPGDYDGDGKIDLAVWRASEGGKWYVVLSSGAEYPDIRWGIRGDIPVPGDYDGDGKSDPAVWRPSNSTWYIIQSSNGFQRVSQWGAVGDIPLEMNGCPAVWRPSNGTWYVDCGGPEFRNEKQWGKPGDVPIPGDYDGDGTLDYAVWRWETLPPKNSVDTISNNTINLGVTSVHIIKSSDPEHPISVSWGLPGEVPVPADYDGDGKTDLAGWYDGKWMILNSRDFTTKNANWGLRGDLTFR